MVKVKDNGGGPYRDKLKLNARQRYLEKLQQLNNVDPYELSVKDWSTDLAALPPLSYPDIVNYLVFGLSAYTMQEFKSYKSLGAYEQFCNGWVQDLLIHKPGNCENTAIQAKVRLHSFSIHNENGEIRKISTPILAPTPLELNNYYADLHKTTVGKAALLSVLPDYCKDRDPVQPKPKSLVSLRDTAMIGSEYSVLEQHCQSLKSQAEVSGKQAEQIEIEIRRLLVISSICGPSAFLHFGKEKKRVFQLFA